MGLAGRGLTAGETHTQGTEGEWSATHHTGLQVFLAAQIQLALTRALSTDLWQSGPLNGAVACEMCMPHVIGSDEVHWALNSVFARALYGSRMPMTDIVLHPAVIPPHITPVLFVITTY